MENNQSHNPEVSIIIPTYNRGPVLKRAIESIIAQTFSDWELWVIDDQSSDSTQEIMRSFSNDPRIFYIRPDNRLGVCESRNLGIKNSHGKFIAFLDSDDEWLPTKLEKQLAVFRASSPHTGLVYTSTQFIDVKTGNKRIRKAQVRGDVFETVLATNPIGTPSGVMVRKECFEVAGYFDSTLVALEDWELWIRIAEKYAVDVVPEPLINYFEGYSDSLTSKNDKTIQGYEILWRKYHVTDKRILRIHYAKIAHRLCYSGDLKRGRQYLIKVWCMDWWNAEHVILLLVSFLGTRIYHWFTFLILKIKQ